jgi:hypothetical protein
MIDKRLFAADNTALTAALILFLAFFGLATGVRSGSLSLLTGAEVISAPISAMLSNLCLKEERRKDSDQEIRTKI